ncbi:MAG: quinolinate synthase NadA [Deltaproteobacteria bacterium]|jgi:quinolinate synthase|nr:quinolinate synthase NadA [Deltaproteobacteria bacterium]
MLSERKKIQVRRIMELKEILGAEILAHYYQRSEVKGLSDFVGGSRSILRRAAVSRARALIVCGVDFMAAAAARLRPDLPVIAPRQDAGCPYSRAAGPELAREARLRDPGLILAAGLKARPDVIAHCDLDLSLEAASDASLDSAPAAGFRAPSSGIRIPDSVFFSPAPAPAFHLRASAGSASRRVAILPGLTGGPEGEAPGERLCGIAPACAIHAQTTAEEAARARATYPGALLGANVLCLPEVREACDFSGDSDGLARLVASLPAREYVLFCEAGLSETLEGRHPGSVFRTTETEMFCPNMKLTNVKDVLRALEALEAGAFPEAAALGPLEAGRGGGASPAGGPL